MSIPAAWAVTGSFTIFTTGKVIELYLRTAFAERQLKSIDRLIDLGILLRTDAAYRNLPAHYFTAEWIQAVVKGLECTNGILNHSTYEWKTTSLLGAPAFSHCNVYQGAVPEETTKVVADPAGAASQNAAVSVHE